MGKDIVDLLEVVWLSLIIKIKNRMMQKSNFWSRIKLAKLKGNRKI